MVLRSCSIYQMRAKRRLQMAFWMVKVSQSQHLLKILPRASTCSAVDDRSLSCIGRPAARPRQTHLFGKSLIPSEYGR